MSFQPFSLGDLETSCAFCNNRKGRERKGGRRKDELTLMVIILKYQLHGEVERTNFY